MGENRGELWERNREAHQQLRELLATAGGCLDDLETGGRRVRSEPPEETRGMVAEGERWRAYGPYHVLMHKLLDALNILHECVTMLGYSTDAEKRDDDREILERWHEGEAEGSGGVQPGS